MEKRITWTTQKVKDAQEKTADGYILKPWENPFHDKNPNLRRHGLSFKMTPEEIEEYVNCAKDIHYFAENYCWIKGDKGEPILIPLRDYQKDILDLFQNNKKSILMASRQIGKCATYTSSIVIYDKKLKVYKKTKLFKFFFEIKQKKTIYDYLKYGLYWLIDKIQ